MASTPRSFDVFFSYNNQDALAVEAIARNLVDQGVTVFLDRWELVAGTPWSQRLEEVLRSCGAVAVFLGMHGLGPWQEREKDLALDRQARDRSFSVIPVVLPGAEPALGFLTGNTWIDFRRSAQDAESVVRLVAAVRGLPPGSGPGNVSENCPYRGLRFFRDVDEGLFFGREAFIERIETTLRQKPLVAVVGPSGSGKSSVVRAGLVPRLRKSDEEIWDVVTMVPGEHPLESLAAALLPLLDPMLAAANRPAKAIEDAAAFASGKLHLRSVVAEVLQNQPDTGRLLLVVDQSEELFTQTREKDERKTFLDEILDATTASRLSVVLTLRADFLKDFLEVLDSPQAATVYVKPMSAAELRQAVELPAAKMGLGFESGLVQRILDAVEGRPGQLPLLEFVLKQLWEQRKGGVLTHAAYERIGEVEGAIAVHADRELSNLSVEEQAIARQIFLQLVRPVTPPAPESDDEVKVGHSRTRTSFAELGIAKLPVVRKLADAHLLVTGRNDVTGEEVVDLVHEALIEEWKTLQSWLESDRLFLTWREQFRMLRNAFGRGGLRGEFLREAKRWLRERPEDLRTSERAYIESSIASRKREIRVWSVTWLLGLAIAGFFLLNWKQFWPDDDGSQDGTSTVMETGDPTETMGATTTDIDTSDDGSSTQTNLPPLSAVRIPASPVKIGVVVHIVYRTDEENLSDNQVRSQIEALNRDFRGRNVDLSEVPLPFRQLTADAMIEFALHNVVRTKTTKAAFEADDSVKDTTRDGAAPVDPDRFLNIWVCNLEQTMEYAMMPGAPAKRDGVVISYKVFGTAGSSARLSQFSRGRLAVHSIGHYLGLHHLWGTRPLMDCTDDDEVADTPRQEKPHFGKPAFPQISCNNGPNGDMFMNFMDYTDDDVRVMFTKGQVLRMHQVLQGPRRGLIAPAMAAR